MASGAALEKYNAEDGSVSVRPKDFKMGKMQRWQREKTIYDKQG